MKHFIYSITFHIFLISIASVNFLNFEKPRTSLIEIDLTLSHEKKTNMQKNEEKKTTPITKKNEIIPVVKKKEIKNSQSKHNQTKNINSQKKIISLSDKNLLKEEITNELKNMKFNNNAKTVTRKNPETFSKASYKFGTINNPHPPYPLIARKKGWEGKLLLNVKINADGTVKDIKIEQSSGYKILDDISKKTLKKWSFIPARLGKKNTEDNLKIPVRFVLKD